MVRNRDKFTDPNRGALAEWIVLHILQSWKRSGKIWDYIQVKVLDPYGIDAVITLRGGMVVVVQIKSSLGHIKNHFRLHPFVKFLFLVEDFPRSENDMETIRVVEEKFKKAVNDFVEQAVNELLNGSKKAKAIK